MKTIFTKSVSIITVLLLSLTFLQANAQSVEARVATIREMFAQVTKLENTLGTKTCISGRGINRENGSSFTQSAKQCGYPNGYSVISASLEGWEWGATPKFYFKNNTLFFVYINYSSVVGTAEYRIYFNESGNIIRILEKFDDITDNPQKTNITVSDMTEKRRIANMYSDMLSKARGMIR